MHCVLVLEPSPACLNIFVCLAWAAEGRGVIKLGSPCFCSSELVIRNSEQGILALLCGSSKVRKIILFLLAHQLINFSELQTVCSAHLQPIFKKKNPPELL